MDPLDDITEQQFKDGRDHRFGTTKPEKLDIPFQNAMIEGGQWAYTVRKKFLSEGDDTEEGDEDAGLTATKVLKKHYGKPIFCNSRVGQASVKSPDGRQVLIGGEHEDFYDPDFLVYNDVIVFHTSAKGKPDQCEFDVFGNEI